MTYTDRIQTVDEVMTYVMLPAEAGDVLLPPARRLHAAAVALGDSAHADLLRMDVCHRLRLGQDTIFAGRGDPVSGYAALLDGAATYLEASAQLAVSSGESGVTCGNTTVLDVTAEHYGHLWGEFSPGHYFDEAMQMLHTRMSRNGVETVWFRGKRAVDCGCGGGRYTVALKKVGFDKVVGVDWSEEALEGARLRAGEAGIEGVIYKRANVLDLPFDDNEFDFVFSNGVLHHTENVLRGIRELLRVMKPGGRGWLYLYARPGGLDRLTHYLARLLLKHANHEVCRRYCRTLGLAANRTFFLLDLWLVPIAECYTPDEVEVMLQQAGCQEWRRMTRGENRDLVEQIHRGVPYASLKFGVGENRYFFEGKQVQMLGATYA